VPVTTLREVALLQDLIHPHIVRLREVVPCPPRLYLVFDYMDFDLKQCLDKEFKKGMPAKLIQSCMYQILDGLAFCHARLVLHRDLKPQNVLIDLHGRVKLADFGLARAFQPKRTYTQEVVTLWYRAPELLLGQQEYTASVDLWSTGCILAELTCRKPLFPGDSEIDQIFRIFRLLGTPDDSTWEGVTQLPDFQPIFPRWSGTPIETVLPNLEPLAVRLLSELIAYQPSSRIRAEDALQHEYFDGLRGRSHVLVPLVECKADANATASPQTACSPTSNRREAADESLPVVPIAPVGDDAPGPITGEGGDLASDGAHAPTTAFFDRSATVVGVAESVVPQERASAAATTAPSTAPGTGTSADAPSVATAQCISAAAARSGRVAPPTSAPSHTRVSRDSGKRKRPDDTDVGCAAPGNASDACSAVQSRDLKPSS